MVRQSAVREVLPFLFDPNDFKDIKSELKVASYQLTPTKLLEQAKVATAIMRTISRRVSSGTEERKEDPMHIPSAL